MVLTAKRVLEEIRAWREFLDSLDHVALLDFPEVLVFQVLKVRLVNQAKRAIKASLVRKERRELQALEDCQVHKANLERGVKVELKVHLDPSDLRAKG